MERWRPIPGFQGRYEVSDLGRVRSLQFRSVQGPEIMKSSLNYSGYHVLTLGSNPKRQFRLHCLVLEAFVGPRPAGMQGCHNDSNKDHNWLSNLRWDTPKGNIADRERKLGSDNPNSKLTDDQRSEIVRRRLLGEAANDLAAEFGVTNTRVYQLVKAA
jgi:hypothetical protein